MSVIPFSGSSRSDVSPLAHLMMDPKIIGLCSTLIAKLEYIRYDETRRGVFRTKWARDMFHLAVEGLDPDTMKGFDIDAWFSDILARSNPESKQKFEFRPSQFNQTIETNWMLHLFEAESRTAGFMMLLHNGLELEDSTHTKMAEKSKKEDEYDFLGVGPRNKATQLMLGHQEAHRARIAPKK